MNTWDYRLLNEFSVQFSRCIAPAQNVFILVLFHSTRDDMPAALETLISCYKKYGKILQLHNIYCKLVEKGDADLLQKG